MANDEAMGRMELPKLSDDGTNNNYGSWKTRAYYKLQEWGLWKYIEGLSSKPPTITTLHLTATHHSLDDDGQFTTVHVRGNKEEHEAAIAAAEPWHTGNELALGHIYNALPNQSLHLLLGISSAKDAWECLCSNYQLQNSARVAAIKGQIMTYRCTPDMNITRWLTDMQWLYTTLCSIDVECMTDREFALTILDLMPQDNVWTGFISGLWDKLHDADSRHVPFHSIMLISRIRDEHWCRHKDDDSNQSAVFTARVDAINRSSANKRTRTTDAVATASTPAKRLQTVETDKPKPRCTNPHCARKVGHDTADCIAYTGGKQGQYLDWWQGPWNLHLPELQRTAATNVPPKTHQNSCPPLVAQVHTNNSANRSTTMSAESNDIGGDVHAALAPDVTFHAWSTMVEDDCTHTTVNALDPNLPCDNTCHHDTGANCHIFHDRSMFETYKLTGPLPVRGFGHNLSTTAMGRGTVWLESRSGTQTHQIVLQNVLHVLAAWTNLISGILLDKAGVMTHLGNGTLALDTDGKTIVKGKIVNDMYRLNLTVIFPSSVSLVSQISTPSLISRVELCASGADFYTASWGTQE